METAKLPHAFSRRFQTSVDFLNLGKTGTEVE
jgi:hypothetical protein